MALIACLNVWMTGEQSCFSRNNHNWQAAKQGKWGLNVNVNFEHISIVYIFMYKMSMLEKHFIYFPLTFYFRVGDLQKICDDVQISRLLHTQFSLLVFYYIFVW